MYCLLCRLHQAKGKHNKSASYGMEPAVRFQTSALVEHCSGQKHQDSIAAEMIRRTSIFQEKLDWCLSKLMQPPYRSHYPMLSFIAEVCLSCPVSNAWPERGASVLKWQKNRLRSRIQNDLLNSLLHVSINGPKQQSKELPSLIRDVVAEWLKEKDRRKLKKLPPISATVASSSLPSTTAVPDHPPPLDEATPHDLDLPSSMEVDDPQSINSEPNVDAYVAALQLECDEKSHNMEDSDYESDYFSD